MAQPFHTNVTVIQNLEDAGCTQKCIDAYMELEQQGDTEGKLALLAKHRASLLDDIHRGQKRIDCLDYLVYNLKSKQNN